METIIKGENKIILFNLLDEDGGALILSTLALLTIEIIQNGFRLALYTYGTDSELSLGSSGNQLKVEIRTTLSDRFVPGIVDAIITTGIPDADFNVDPDQIDKTKYEIFTVE